MSPQDLAKHFPGRIFWQAFRDENVLWAFVSRQLLSRSRQDDIRCRVLAPEYDSSDDLLHPARVWQIEHRALGDICILQQDIFHFTRIDVLTTGDNHVALAIENGEITFIIDAAEIAGTQPPIPHVLRSGFGILPIAGHDHRAADENFADVVVLGIVEGRETQRDRVQFPPAREQEAFAPCTGQTMIIRRQAGHHTGLGRTISLCEVASESRRRALQCFRRHG